MECQPRLAGLLPRVRTLLSVRRLVTANTGSPYLSRQRQRRLNNNTQHTLVQVRSAGSITYRSCRVREASSHRRQPTRGHRRTLKYDPCPLSPASASQRRLNALQDTTSEQPQHVAHRGRGVGSASGQIARTMVRVAHLKRCGSHHQRHQHPLLHNLLRSSARFPLPGPALPSCTT